MSSISFLTSNVVKFDGANLPKILDALHVENNGQKLVLEVSQHLGENVVRCIAMVKQLSNLATRNMG